MLTYLTGPVLFRGRAHSVQLHPVRTFREHHGTAALLFPPLYQIFYRERLQLLQSVVFNESMCELQHGLRKMSC